MKCFSQYPTVKESLEKCYLKAMKKFNIILKYFDHPIKYKITKEKNSQWHPRGTADNLYAAKQYYLSNKE